MGRRAFATVVGLSGLAALLTLPMVATASPSTQATRASSGWSWPTGWSAACGTSWTVGGATASCNAIELDNPSSWQGHHVLFSRSSPGGGHRGPTTTTTLPPTTPSGYDPADLQSAYGLTGASSSDGVGRTVAIVDAYNDPNALSDVNTYRAKWGLTLLSSSGSPRFTEVNQSGTTSNVGWSEEISVDLDMVSAICPNCNILLVGASSATFASLGTAENTAARTSGVVSIGNSYGGTESGAETGYDTYYDHPGIAITAASGDGGYGVEYPAASPDVTAVGGTTLEMTGTTRGTETAWSDAGSGCSAYELQQSWQKISNIKDNCGMRAVADVSAVADPNTGVAVYDTFGLSGWTVFGGTSVATQIISAVYGLAGGLPSSTSGAQGLYEAATGTTAYTPSTGVFNAITSGSNASCTSDLCNAADEVVTPGWSGPAGLGTPDGIRAF